MANMSISGTAISQSTATGRTDVPASPIWVGLVSNANNQTIARPINIDPASPINILRAFFRGNPVFRIKNGIIAQVITNAAFTVNT